MKDNKTTTNLKVSCSIPHSPYLALSIRCTCCIFVGLAHFASSLQITRHVGSLHSWRSQLLGIWQWPLRRLYDMLPIWIGGRICSPCLVNHVPHGLPAVPGLFPYIVTQYVDILPNFLLTIPNQTPRGYGGLAGSPFTKIILPVGACFSTAKAVPVLNAPAIMYRVVMGSYHRNIRPW